MKTIITGQILLILCCTVYLIWWYRGFRPGIYISRTGGVNGVLLLITMALGFAGVVFSLMPAEKIREPLVSQVMIVICGIATYFILLVVTKVLFNRVVTTELFLIVGWTMLETLVADRLYAIGSLGGNRSTKKQMDALSYNIRNFQRIQDEFGSVDAFITSEPTEEIVRKLSTSSSKYKMKKFGEALAWEYLRNVGIDERGYRASGQTFRRDRNVKSGD